MKGIKKHSERTDYYGTDVKNNTGVYVPEEVLELAVKLRQLMKDMGLDISITIGTQD